VIDSPHDALEHRLPLYSPAIQINMTPLIPGSDQIHIHPVIFFLPIPYTRHPIVYLLITLLMNFFVNRVDWTEAFSICHICHRLWSRMIPLNHLQTAPCHRSEAKTPLLSRVMIGQWKTWYDIMISLTLLSGHNQVDANVSRPPKRHHCPHCNLKFTYPREVERHKNSLHAAELDSQTRFYCDHTGCKYAPGGTKDGWPRKDNLDRHNRTYQLKLERKKNAGRRRKSPTSGMEDIEP
jgi:hypothetical protein